MSSMILGISGSPRKDANTDRMVQAVLSAARKQGSQTEFVRLYDIHLKPCVACESCLKKGTCVLDDDMRRLVARIRQSDLLVLGTPVYWWSASAGFKTFVDRWYSPEVRKALRKKKVVVVIPFADTDEKTASYTCGSLRTSLDYLGVDLVDIILSPGTTNPGDVDRKKKVLDRLSQAANL